MVDVLTPEQRRLNMSRIRGKDTKPELLLRHGLHARGLRYRLHRKDLPGRPDMVFPRYRAAILVHGCFWHGHDCPLFKLPATRREFWAGQDRGQPGARCARPGEAGCRRLARPGGLGMRPEGAGPVVARCRPGLNRGLADDG